MVRCAYEGCGWQAIAPSREAADEQYAEHIVTEHAETVDADIPDGMVQVRDGEDAEWRTMTVEQALAFHEGIHDGGDE